MQSSYQYHFGGQAAAARGAHDSPSKTGSPAKAQAAQGAAAASSMFVPKVDWGSASNPPTGGAAAAQ